MQSMEPVGLFTDESQFLSSSPPHQVGDKRPRRQASPQEQGCLCFGGRPRVEEARRLTFRDMPEFRDWNSATIIGLCFGDPRVREDFQSFMDNRYNGELIRFLTMLEKYKASSPAERPAIGREVFSTFADQSNTLSPHTVTISGNLHQKLQEKVQSNSFEKNLFDEMEAEVMVLIAANGLHDYLRQFQAPNLEDCFMHKPQFDRFLSFARQRHQGHLVEFVQLVMFFESEIREGAKTPAEREVAANSVLEFGRPFLRQDLVLQTEEMIKAHKFGEDTFAACKNDCLKNIMVNIFPAYASTFVPSEA